jgi:hypothetical protein
MNRREYVTAVIDPYTRLPGTRLHPSRQDRKLAASLHDCGVPFRDLRAAMLLAAARRTLRSADAPALPPIGCLHYFLPVLEEIADQPPEPGYVDYLANKLQPFLKQIPPQASTSGQIPSLLCGR